MDDSGVVQIGEDLALPQEALPERRMAGAVSKKFYGHALFDSTVGAIGCEDNARTAAAKKPNQAVRSAAAALAGSISRDEKVSGSSA